MIKIKIPVAAILIYLAACAGCTNKTSSVNKEQPVINSDAKGTENDTAIKMIRSFYSEYITINNEVSVDEARLAAIKKKYCTARLLSALQQEEMDYDPFLNAQDCDTSWIRTMSVKHDVLENDIYHVQYKDVSTQENIRVKLKLNHENGEYRIDKVYTVVPASGI